MTSTRPWGARGRAGRAAFAAAALFVGVLVGPDTAGAAATYPVGTPNSAAPSGMDLPSASALAGYTLAYATTFAGSSLPAGWSVFTGQPSSDPGAQWGQAHVVVSHGMLQLNTWRDPAYGNEWVAGGVCQCERAFTYGAVFVRSRMTGPGPTQVEILWPAVGWPPEIDFSETYGGTSATMATLHYSSSNLQVHNNLTIDMTQWHTFGVVWTPTSVVYTVDGRAWGTVSDPSQIPSQPLTLHLQQQTWCSLLFACPTQDQSTQVDWVAEYAPSASPPPVTTVRIASFARRSARLGAGMLGQVDRLANQIATSQHSTVSVTGYGDLGQPLAQGQSLGGARARAVAAELRRVLAALHHPVSVSVAGRAGSRAQSRRVNVAY